MDRMILRRGAAVPLLVAVVGICSTVVGVSGQATADKPSIPRTSDGKPDFSGVYSGTSDRANNTGLRDADASVSREGYLDARTLPPLTELGKTMFLRKPTGIERLDNPFGLCIPGGIDGYMQTFYAQEWLQAPKFIVIRYEYINNNSRVVWMDGRQHSTDLEPGYFGESIGKWEGDTLVIDTIGFKEWPIDEFGHYPGERGTRWHTDKLHMVERLTPLQPNVAKYEIIMEDAPYYTGPWKTTAILTRQPTWKLLEMVCNENDRKFINTDAQAGAENR